MALYKAGVVQFSRVFSTAPIDEGLRMAALFWETRGYHNDADPFRQERYSD